MKKSLFLLFSLLVTAISGVWAGGTVTVSTDTGTLTLCNGSSSKYKSWTYNGTPAIKVGVGSADGNDDATTMYLSYGKLRMNAGTYYITAPTGYVITGYTFDLSATSGYIASESGLNARQVSFTTTKGGVPTFTITYEEAVAKPTVTFSAVANGTVSATVDGSAITSGAEVDKNKTVVFTANPNDGYEFDFFTVGESKVTQNPYTHTVTGDVTVSATFKESTAEPGSSMSNAIELTAGEGKAVVANKWYKFTTVTEGTVSFTGSAYSDFNLLDATENLKWEFSADANVKKTSGTLAAATYYFCAQQDVTYSIELPKAKTTTNLSYLYAGSNSIEVHVGDDDFTPTTTVTTGYDGTVAYESSNTAVATVDATGKIHVVGEGTATITATAPATTNFTEATATFTVTALKALPDYSAYEAVYSATMDYTGYLGSNYDGESAVTATRAEDKHSYTLKFTNVKLGYLNSTSVNVGDITVSGCDLTANEDGSVTISATSGTFKVEGYYTFNISEAKATFTSATAGTTGKVVGTTTSDGLGTATVTFKSLKPANLALAETSTTLKSGMTYDLAAQVSKAEGAGNVTYSSSNTAVATVSDEGVITAGTTAGTATITVAVAKNSVCKADSKTFTVTVEEKGLTPEDAIELKDDVLTQIQSAPRYYIYHVPSAGTVTFEMDEMYIEFKVNDGEYSQADLITGSTTNDPKTLTITTTEAKDLLFNFTYLWGSTNTIKASFEKYCVKHTVTVTTNADLNCNDDFSVLATGPETLVIGEAGEYQIKETSNVSIQAIAGTDRAVVVTVNGEVVTLDEDNCYVIESLTADVTIDATFTVASFIEEHTVDLTNEGKFVKNGRLVIVKGGKIYNACGIEL